jgi:hypothetical protein
LIFEGLIGRDDFGRKWAEQNAKVKMKVKMKVGVLDRFCYVIRCMEDVKDLKRPFSLAEWAFLEGKLVRVRHVLKDFFSFLGCSVSVKGRVLHVIAPKCGLHGIL